MRRTSIPVLLLLAALTPPVGAAEGRFPVWMPGVITQPGHYILTRDISAAAGPIISIQADGVTLDLNGHTIASTDMGQPVIHIGGASGAEKGIVIVGGKVQGGMHGILYSPPPDDDKPLSLAGLTLSGATEAAVKGEGFTQLEAQGIIIINTKLGFDLQQPPDPISPTARIRNADIRAGGGIHCEGVVCSIREVTIEQHPPDPVTPTAAIRFSGVTGGEAVGIVIIGGTPAASAPPIVEVLASKGIIIINTKVYGPGTGDGGPCVLVDSLSSDFIIDDSKLAGCGGDGIRALGTNGAIRRNLVSDSGGNGIFAGGDNWIIDDSKLAGSSGAGIWFETSNHVYRNNILRGNTGGGTDGPGVADATDAGGNVE